MTLEMSQYYRDMKFKVIFTLLCFVQLYGIVALETAPWISVDAGTDILEMSYSNISDPKPGLPI